MALETKISILTSAPLFSLLDRPLLQLLAFAAEPHLLQQGDILFRKGDPSDGGYVVAQGAITLDAGDGSPMFVAEPGAVVGYTALFISTVHPATATAQARSAVLRITPTLMHYLLGQFPSAAVALHNVLAADVLSFADRLEQVGQIGRPWTGTPNHNAPEAVAPKPILHRPHDSPPQTRLRCPVSHSREL